LKGKKEIPSGRTKKSGSKKLGFLIIATILVIATIYYFYSAEQAQIRGYNFGNELQAIQDDLKDEQADFYSKVSMWKEASITKDQILEYGHTHVLRMNDIITKYTELQMPDAFSGSVKLFKLSTETQLESDQHLLSWIENDDETEKIRADELLQASFEYEMAALASFEKTKRNPNP
jgi:hypothetical protein